MSANMTRFLGDTPFRVFIRLLVLSFIVGLVLDQLGWHPFRIFHWAQELIVKIYNMGFDAFVSAFGYILFGAVVVVPVFLLMRVLKLGGRSRGRASGE